MHGAFISFPKTRVFVNASTYSCRVRHLRAAALLRESGVVACARPPSHPEICAVAQPDAVLTRRPVVFRRNRYSHPPSTDSRPSGNRPRETVKQQQ